MFYIGIRCIEVGAADIFYPSQFQSRTVSFPRVRMRVNGRNRRLTCSETLNNPPKRHGSQSVRGCTKEGRRFNKGARAQAEFVMPCNQKINRYLRSDEKATADMLNEFHCHSPISCKI